MTSLDYIVVVFYLTFMLALGPVYKKFSQTASDYFRGGGGMLWWMVGMSGFMTAFTAWSFVGGAGKAYETGTFFALLYAANTAATLFTFFYTAHRFRQMRVITPVEAIRKRFGPTNEQVFTWMPVPLFVVFGGIGLYTIAIFLASVFGVSMVVVIVVLGVTVTVMSIFGGSWAVVASDFLQGLTIITITLVMAFLVLQHPGVGGLGGMLEKLPERHFDWTQFARPSVIFLFAFMLLFGQLIQMNSMLTGAAKYVFCKNGRDARKAALIILAGFIVLTPFWLIPPMAAAILHPDLAAEYPNLNNPNEAAYVAVALNVLPAGLMGLLVCGIFAATMSSMDSGLNRSAGIIVRNFYLTVINPAASESQQINLGRAITAVFGLMMIGMGLYFNTLQALPLFDLILLAAAAVGIPTSVPLFLGMFIKRVPAWAAWSTAAVGFAASVLLRIPLGTDGFIQSVFPVQPALTPQEIADLNIAITTGVLITVCGVWFLATMFFYKRSPAAYQAQVESFFSEMNTPIDMRTEHVPSYDNDRRQYIVIGQACFFYGLFILLLALFPNTLTGRLGFAFCGVSIGGVGAICWWLGRKLKLPPWEKAETDA